MTNQNSNPHQLAYIRVKSVNMHYFNALKLEKFLVIDKCNLISLKSLSDLPSKLYKYIPKIPRNTKNATIISYF